MFFLDSLKILKPLLMRVMPHLLVKLGTCTCYITSLETISSMNAL